MLFFRSASLCCCPLSSSLYLSLCQFLSDLASLRTGNLLCNDKSHSYDNWEGDERRKIDSNLSHPEETEINCSYFYKSFSCLAVVWMSAIRLSWWVIDIMRLPISANIDRNFLPFTWLIRLLCYHCLELFLNLEAQHPTSGQRKINICNCNGSDWIW